MNAEFYTVATQLLTAGEQQHLSCDYNQPTCNIHVVHVRCTVKH